MGKKRKPWQRQFHPRMAEIIRSAQLATERGEEPRRHHIVPRFYLENWADAKSQVAVTRLTQAKRRHVISTKRAATITDFYRIRELEGNASLSPVFWEVAMSRYEDAAKRASDSLISNGTAWVNSSDFAGFLWFLAIQATRGVQYRRRAAWLHERLLVLCRGVSSRTMRSLLEEAGINNPSGLALSFEQEVMRRTALGQGLEKTQTHLMHDSAHDAGQVFELLSQRNFSVIPTAPILVTTDEPLVPLSNDGTVLDWIDEAPLIVFPLSPNRLLAMYRKDIYIDPRWTSELNFRETLDLNRAMLSYAWEQSFEPPCRHYAMSLFTPESSAVDEVVIVKEDGQTLRFPRRWVEAITEGRSGRWNWRRRENCGGEWPALGFIQAAQDCTWQKGRTGRRLEHEATSSPQDDAATLSRR